MTRTLLFRREFLGYSGGHGKVWDYYRHAQMHAGWRACVHFTPDSVSAGNPWREAGESECGAWRPLDADALFLAGMDWASYPDDAAGRPVINLIQGVRHADDGLPLRAFLARPAIRICVGQPVADAIHATGVVRGPVFTIDAGIGLADDSPPFPERPRQVLVAAQKQPALGADIAERLRAAGVDVECVTEWLPRADFLARMRGARIVIALPLSREGFYLPGLEAMALGCAVVMPDAIGNRAYAAPGRNALMPAANAATIAADTLGLLRDATRLRAIVDAGVATAEHHGIPRERAAFHHILDDIDTLWAKAWDATSH